MSKLFSSAIVLLIVFLSTVVLCEKYTQVENVIVIVMENWSYDGLFGVFDKTNGISAAPELARVQLDRNNEKYQTLPQVQPGVPMDLPNDGPFDLSKYVDPSKHTIDLTHMFYTEQMQINEGAMNKFVTYGSSKGLTMSYYDATQTYIGQLAKNYTLMRNWHHAAFGGSWLNHIWLVCPNTPVFPNAPAEMVNKVTENGKALENPDDPELSVTPDYYAVNTVYSPQPPTPAGYNTSHLLPLQNLTTIGDVMTAYDVSWKWYSGGYTDAMNGNPDPTFQYHHQPFVYFSNYAVGKPGRDNLQDEVDFLRALKNGNLPQVSFYKPLGKYNMHPDYSIVTGEAQAHLKMIVESIQASKYWKKSLVIVTFDEHGGRWDHKSPPKVDRWGPGSRIPTILVSPFVKKGYIDNTYHDSTSIMKFIQDRWDLPSIGTRDAAQNGFGSVFVNNSPSSKAWLVLLFAPLIILIVGLGAIVYAVGYGYKHRKYERV